MHRVIEGLKRWKPSGKFPRLFSLPPGTFFLLGAGGLVLTMLFGFFILKGFENEEYTRTEEGETMVTLSTVDVSSAEPMPGETSALVGFETATFAMG